MTQTSDIITTPSHSAATDSRNQAQILSWYSVVTGGKSGERKKIHWEKNINSDFQCNFLKDCVICHTSKWFSRLKTVSYISLIFTLVRLCKDSDKFPFLEKSQNSSESWNPTHMPVLLSNSEQNKNLNKMEGDR